MNGSYRIHLVLFMLLVPAFTASGAESFGSKELINNADKLDETVVIYRGEAVTAVMNRGEHAWINLNDGNNAVGIWCKSDSLKNVRFLGDYKNKGDYLEVEGVFHRACPIHSGELDIHADSVKILSVGFPLRERVSVKRLRIAAAFFVLTIIAIVALRKRI